MRSNGLRDIGYPPLQIRIPTVIHPVADRGLHVAHPIEIDSLGLLNRAIEEHYEEMKATLRRRGHGSDAADIIHELYIRFAEQPEKLGRAHSIRAFLSRAAVNLGIDRARRNGLEQRIFSGSEAEGLAVPASTPAPDFMLEVTDRLRRLKDAIGELPRTRRAIFVLHRLHQLPPDAIARKLGITRVTVDRHLRAALLHCLERVTESD
ncbi:RNA polymerase sigma factor [Hyphomicrobium sulfonivorans]|uniref:RNA polymerase sigma factor n=1 Tax=Hyphomicrobium sulfonivorans TaxID=121290 RepID=UPI0015703B11|nr:sigma-70 family RNA polymerase sigma factor [Hyphomicrobium sulfonivorans]MBI1648835.1 sigma-70 family RNA polymerase sigma factor [Hyphomicrobium sulfonivorans]NSL70630.1 siderophore-interacting protein [Hyphomicrobium sulfonivorans]